MGLFRREPRADRAALDNEVREWIDRLAVPCVRIDEGRVTSDPRRSFAGGHPYLPMGAEWPMIDDEAAAFVAQINFAEAPPVPGVPAAGLLQWFVKPDDVLGLTFDDTAGGLGFTVRWYASLEDESRRSPTDPAPTDPEDVAGFAAQPGTGLDFSPGRCLPAWDELPAEIRAHDVWSRWATAHNEELEDAEFAYEEYVRGYSSLDRELVTGDRLGGSASFVQRAPRGPGRYPPLGSPGSGLLVELHDIGGMGWGDAGIGHLFGDPAAVARGDLTSVTYHWDCG